MRATCLLQPRRAPAGAVWDACGCCATLGRRTCSEWQCRWPSASTATWTSPSLPTNTYTHSHKFVRSDTSKQPARGHLACQNKPLQSHIIFFLDVFISAQIQSFLLLIVNVIFHGWTQRTHRVTVRAAETHRPATISFPECDLSSIMRHTVNQSLSHCIIVWELCPNTKIITLSIGPLWLMLARKKKHHKVSLSSEPHCEVGTLLLTEYWQCASSFWDK